ncbi:hypothetical protein OFB80_30060, partial [Escherichia coli]|nr:hypothetical protein [Escherichia coli]
GARPPSGPEFPSASALLGALR